MTMPQVISIKAFYTSKRTSFFYFFPFFKRTTGLHNNNLKQPIKQLQYQLRSWN